MPSPQYPTCTQHCRAPHQCDCVDKEHHTKAWDVAWQMEREERAAGNQTPPGFVDSMARKFLQYMTLGGS